MKKFKHNYDTSTDVERIAGFSDCLNELYNVIQRLTQKNPAKRFIDAVELLNRIRGTNDDFAKIFKELRGELTIESFTTRN